MGILGDPGLESQLAALHAQSDDQGDSINAYFRRRIQEGTLSWDGFDAETTSFFSDKLVAIEKDKAEYCYALCRAMKVTRIVECGTSHGVSTLYLAAALRDNIAAAGKASGEGHAGGLVIATEWEVEKAAIARKNFEAAGLSRFIDLRVGDLNDTLADLEGQIHFVLMDIWTEAVMPAIHRIVPHLRSGSVIIADNTVQSRQGYEAYFAYIADPTNRLRTMTLPFAGGLEFTLRI